MVFSKAERANVLAKHPEMKSKVTDVAKELGKRWKALSPAQVEAWKAKAAAL